MKLKSFLSILLILFSLNIFSQEIDIFKATSYEEIKLLLKKNPKFIKALLDFPTKDYYSSVIKSLKDSKNTELHFRILREIDDEKIVQLVHYVDKELKKNPEFKDQIQKSLERLKKRIPAQKLKLDWPIRCFAGLSTFIASRDFFHSFFASFVKGDQPREEYFSMMSDITTYLTTAFTISMCTADLVQSRFDLITHFQNVRDAKNVKKISQLFSDDIEKIKKDLNFKENYESNFLSVELIDNLKEKILLDLYKDSLNDVDIARKKKLKGYLDYITASYDHKKIVKMIRKAFSEMPPSQQRSLESLFNRNEIQTNSIDNYMDFHNKLVNSLEADVMKLSREDKGHEVLREYLDLDHKIGQKIVDSLRPMKVSNLCYSFIAINMAYIGYASALGQEKNIMDDEYESVIRNKIWDIYPGVVTAIISPCILQVAFYPLIKRKYVLPLKKDSESKLLDRRKIISIVGQRKQNISYPYSFFENADTIEDVIEKHYASEHYKRFSFFGKQLTFTLSCINSKIKSTQSKFKKRNPAGKAKVNTNCMDPLESMVSLREEEILKDYEKSLKYLTKRKKDKLLELLKLISNESPQLSNDKIFLKAKRLLNQCSPSI